MPASPADITIARSMCLLVDRYAVAVSRLRTRHERHWKSWAGFFHTHRLALAWDDAEDAWRVLTKLAATIRAAGRPSVASWLIAEGREASELAWPREIREAIVLPGDIDRRTL